MTIDEREKIVHAAGRLEVDLARRGLTTSPATD